MAQAVDLGGIPECDDASAGQCAWRYSDKGAIIYDSYDACSRTDILLPGFNLLPDWLLAVAYGLALVWIFFGVAIISDIFMASIEVITASERQVTRKDENGNKYSVTVLVWNATVANLTLMALGSSAPEIMLAVIETATTLGKPTPEIGPATIVGSAAFNLLVIVAICIVAVPEGESKRITEFGVFLWTAAVSLFAYIWMLIVYEFWTPDEVTAVEAWLTLAYLPILVGAAYLLDARPWSRATRQKLLAARPDGDEDGSGGGDGGDDARHPYQVVVGGRGANGSGRRYEVSRAEAHDYLAKHDSGMPLEHAAYAVAKSRHEESALAQSARSGKRGGGEPTSWRDNDVAVPVPATGRTLAAAHATSSMRVARGSVAKGRISESDRREVVERAAGLLRRKQAAGQQAALTEDDIDRVVSSVVPAQPSFLAYRMNARAALTGQAHLPLAPRQTLDSDDGADLRRHSAPSSMKLDRLVKVMLASEEYRVLESQLRVRLTVFCHRSPGTEDEEVRLRFRTVEGTAKAGSDYVATSGIVVFAARDTSAVIEVPVLEDDEVEEDEEFYVELFEPEPKELVLLQRARARVTIVDTTDPGYVHFESSTATAHERAERVTLNVLRKRGATGALKVLYSTQSDTAVADLDYEHVEGSITFEDGECQKAIEVRLNPTRTAHRSFVVFLKPDPQQLTLAGEPYVARRRSMCTVTIVENEDVGKVQALVERMLERRAGGGAAGGPSAWAAQFRTAVMPGAEVDDAGEEAEPSALDIALHYVSITWKLLFAAVPPPDLAGGWPCFVVSLAMIAGLTYVIAPLATMFGCAVGLGDEMTAIVFVALGTSLPDTFASRQAAVQADDADAAIGNVTGSNSVNVFMGLGLPWVIATLYYGSRGETYVTPAGALSFSVTIYTVCAVICLALLVLKRCLGGELGGSGFMRWGIASITFGLWLVYLVLSGLRSKGHIEWNV